MSNHQWKLNCYYGPLKNRLGNYLIENLKNIKGIRVPIKKLKNSKIVHHLICLQYDEKATGVTKDIYLKALEKEGIELYKGYPHTLYAIYYSFLKKGINYRKGLCPVAENVIKKSIWINQIRPPTTKKDIKEIIYAFKKVDVNLFQLKNL